jgi:dipeptidyl aminopeptidase/acylaminoacyl peptidase
MLKRWPAIAAAVMSCVTAAAAAPPAEVFFKDPDLVEAVLSPSGRKLALLGGFGGERVSLAVAELGAGGKILRTAQFHDGDVSQAHWVDDDRLLFSVTDLSDGSGRPRGAPGLFAINPDGSDARQLVRRMGHPTVARPGARDRSLSWNHRLLTVPRPRSGEANEEVLVVEFGTDEQRLETPRWLNVRTGRTRSVDVEIPPDAVGWMADSRGELRVAFTARDGRRGALWRTPGQPGWQTLYESDLLNTPFGIHAVDAAGQLYVTRPQGPAGERVLSRYDFKAGAPAAEPLVSTPGFDFIGQVLSDADGAALGVRVVTDAEGTVWQHPVMQALQQEADARLPGRVNRISCRRCGQQDMVALVRSYSDVEPGEFWLYQARPVDGEPAWRPVGRVRKDVKPADMARMALHRIRARDGRDLPVWVTRRPGATAPQPAVVLVHGGPWVRGGVFGWRAQAQFLASRGYVVIEPEFRGSLGYGQAHYRAGFKQWGQAMQDDVADALRWAQQQGLASDKACIAGGSYGGYSALMGLVRDAGLYRCGVAWVAVTDLELLLKGSWWVDDDTIGEARRHRLPDTIGDLRKHADMIAANSPVRQAAAIRSPVLLAFGEADRRVPLAHGKRMREALQQAGNEPEWITYAGEGHGFALLKNRVDFAERMAAFLARHLNP